MSIKLDGSPCYEQFTQVHFWFESLGEGAWSLSDRSALGPGRDSDISEGLPGEPLSPLTHTQTRGLSASPAPTMSPCLLGCVVFCLLQAGESWGRVPLGVPALSMSTVTETSVLLLHRGGPRWCHPGSQIPGPEDRTEHDTEMYSGSGSWPHVLVPTRHGTGAEADPLLSWDSVHGGRRHARRVQRLQIKQRELPSDAELCQPIPDICVLLHQQLLHGAARPPPLCAKTTRCPRAGS